MDFFGKFGQNDFGWRVQKRLSADDLFLWLFSANLLLLTRLV